MNRKLPCLEMNKLRILGSWSQCMRKNERGLSMNRRFVLVVVLVLVIDWMAFLRGGGRARGRVGSRSQCTAKKSCRLSMNRNAGLRHGLFSVPNTPGAVPGPALRTAPRF